LGGIYISRYCILSPIEILILTLHKVHSMYNDFVVCLLGLSLENIVYCSEISQTYDLKICCRMTQLISGL